MSEFIPVASPDLSGNEEKYVVDAIRSTWISSTGKYIDQFEQAFAEKCQAGHALVVANGTIALHLALLALDVGSGDEVLVPSLTFVATANVVKYVGAEPVFVDVDPATWTMDPALIEASITPRTKGIIAVHLYGHPCDMDAINKVAGDNRLWVVEDAAEAHFAKYKGQPVGGLGKIGTFSFFGNKILTSGEGGAITFNDDALTSRTKMLRGQGMDPERRYYFPIIGHNFRLTNIACAMLCAQLERADEIIARRREIFDLYRRQLQGIPGIGFQPVADWADPAHWLFCITVDKEKYGRSRDELMAHLLENGVDTRPFFIPLHTLPPFRALSAQRGEELPVTMRLADAGMNLPTFSSLCGAEMEQISNVVGNYFGGG